MWHFFMIASLAISINLPTCYRGQRQIYRTYRAYRTSISVARLKNIIVCLCVCVCVCLCVWAVVSAGYSHAIPAHLPH